MPRAREIARQRARDYRDAKAMVAREEEKARRGQLSRVLRRAQSIVSDPDFIAFAASQHAASAPKRLFRSSREDDESDVALEVLDFAVAWKFFFPVLQNDATRSYLDRSFPGFVDELKDAFIGLVMKGPFVGERRPAINRRMFD